MSKIGIIVRREFTQRVRKKSFILTTILTPLLFLAMMFVPVWLATTETATQKEIWVVDRSGLVADRLENSDAVAFLPATQSVEELRASKGDGKFGYLVVGADIVSRPDDLQLYSAEKSTVEIDRAITSQIGRIIEREKMRAYDIKNLDRIMADIRTRASLSTYQLTDDGGEKESSSAVSYAIAFAFGLLIYMFVFLYGAMVMNGVIEEKSSRVLEILVSSVKPFELMCGKILGIAAVAMTQLAIWIVLLAVLGSAATSLLTPETAQQVAAAQMSPGMNPGVGTAELTEALDSPPAGVLSTLTDLNYIVKLAVVFLLYFIGGYLLYAAMFAAIGSAVDNAADSQQLTLPVTVPLIVAFLITMSVVREPNSSLAFWFSMIPFTSPVVMMARLPYEIPFWEIVLSLALLYATFIGMVWVAGKIYRIGIFMYGKKPTWKELIKWISYKD
jgi:ABC-2 type transport system permease protein